MSTARGWTDAVARRLTAAVLATALLAAAPAAGAQSLTVGTTAGSNGFPFSSLSARDFVRYQQVYAASAFASVGGPIAIDRLTFFNTQVPGSVIGGGAYQIRLSTTSAAVGTLSATLDANVGADAQTFFVGNPGGGLSIVGSSPFVYDFTRGNLLLDLLVTGQTGTGTLDRTDAAEGLIGRTYGSATTATPTALEGTNPLVGLVTAFGYARAAVVVPEPSTWLLLGTGLLAIGAVAPRRRDRG